MTLDPRVNAFRGGLADARLEGSVEAVRFVTGEPGEIVAAATAVRREPRPDAMRTTEALMGERVAVFERADGWLWAQLLADGYVGYVEESAVGEGAGAATHRVAVPLTYIYPQANLKSEPASPVFLNSMLRVEAVDETWARLDRGGFVFSRHLRPAAARAPDWVAVAEGYAGVPYLWGGKTQAGLDCSGLVQLALQAGGIEAPRDTDMLERALGFPVDPEGPLERGDLVFWKGHVGVMLDARRLLHANGHHMLVAIEPLAEASERIAARYGRVTSARRLAGGGN